MQTDAYKKIRARNGERFAQTIRNHHNGILQIPDIARILYHAGHDAEPLLPYLVSLLRTPGDNADSAQDDPFQLLDQAGYDAFHADTLEKQNSIARFFAPRELLCTFNDHTRHQKYHIVHAVKKDADRINRADFKDNIDRQDAYGASVISIQIAKNGGFIKITNRYNHAVSGSDNTFNSNPDNIIPGLSSALKKYFNVDFSSAVKELPNDFILLKNRLFRFHTEKNNIYFGDQAWATDGVIHPVNRAARDALFDGFLFDNKAKTLKKIDPASADSFADDFNRYYGGCSSLSVDRNGNLLQNGKVLIGTEKSCIKTLDLPLLATMSNNSLSESIYLTHVNLPALAAMGDRCFYNARALTGLYAPALATMGSECFHNARALTRLSFPALTAMGSECFHDARALISLSLPALTAMGSRCFHDARALISLSLPALAAMGDRCFYYARALISLSLPALAAMGDRCFYYASALTHLDAPALTAMGDWCFHDARALTNLSLPALTTIGKNCFSKAKSAIRHKAYELSLKNVHSRTPANPEASGIPAKLKIG